MVKVKKRPSRKNKEILVYRRVVLTFTLTFILFVSIILFGIQGLVKLASFLGGLRGAGAPIEETKEEPLLSPRLAALPVATNSAKIFVSGFAESGAMVDIFLNDVLMGSTLASKEGKFEISDLTLGKGENKIYASTRIDNKQSPASRTIFITFKETLPKLEIFSPADKSVILGKEGKVEIEGETDPDTSLSINGHWVIVKNDGTFSFELPLAEGENKIEAVARDMAGNEIKEVLSVAYHPK